jgi:hypothetical protein
MEKNKAHIEGWSQKGTNIRVGIATGWTAGVRFPPVHDFSLLHSVQTGVGAHPALPGAPSPGVKWQGREADHSPPPSAEVKNGGAIPPLPHTPSWHSALLMSRILLNFSFVTGLMSETFIYDLTMLPGTRIIQRQIAG